MVILECLGLPFNVLDATLGMCLSYGDEFFAGLWGDGAVVVRYPGGGVLIHHINYESGAPYYMSYSMDPEREKDYLKEFGGKQNKKVISCYDIPQDEVEEASDPEKCVDPSKWLFDKRREDPTEPFFDFGKLEPGTSIFVVSDGMFSFTDADRRPKNFLPILLRLTDLKSLAGEFVLKRMNFFNKENRKAGIIHEDDLSVASIVCLPKKKEENE